MKIKKKHINSINKAIFLIGLFSIIFVWAVRWNGVSGNNYKSIIKSDGNGYYYYFEAILGNESIANQKVNGEFLVKTKNDRVVNKYFVGTAILMSPFVMPAYLFESVRYGDVIFKSEYLQKSISIAALFYLLIGLWAIAKLLLRFNIDEHIIAFGLFALFFGTNLSYYTLLEPSMSHVYSFSLISVFLLVFKQQVDDFQSKKLILLSVLLAIIVLIRPLNIIIVFALPFLCSSLSRFFRIIIKKSKAFPLNIIAVFVFILIVSIQLLFWYLQTDSWLVWPYSNEGFYFLKPHLLDFLFSFRKGVFIYSPFILLTFIVFVIAYRKYKETIILSFGFFTLLFYMLSSWWNWYYGDSYGSRVIIDYYAIIVLLFAMGIQKLNIKTQRVAVIVGGVFVLLNVFQSYQYYHNIMSHFDMNATKYSYIFGKAGSEFENVLGGNDDIVSYHKEPLQTIYGSNNYIDSISNTLLVDKHRIKKMTEGSHSYMFNKSTEYGLNIELPTEKMIKYSGCYIEFSNTINHIEGNMNKVIWRIIYMDSLNNAYNYKDIKINEVPLENGEIGFDNYKINIPIPNSKNDKVQLYIRNYSQAEFNVSDLKIRLWGKVG